MFRRFYFYISILLGLVMTCPVKGQGFNKKMLTEEDYSLWSTLTLESVSDEGKWASYATSYESGIDTVFVHSTNTSRRYSIAGGHSGKFYKDAYFGCLTGEGFQLLDLKTGSTWQEQQVTRFYLASHGVIVLYHTNEDGIGELLLKDQKGRRIYNIDHVTDFSISPDGNAVSYVISEGSSSAVHFISFEHPDVPKQLASLQGSVFHTLVWQGNGKSVAFASKKMDREARRADAFWYYDFKQNQLLSYAIDAEPNWPKELIAWPINSESLLVSDDGLRVYFVSKSIAKEAEVFDKNAVQIWNTADHRLPTYREKYGEPGRGYLIEWIPREHSISIAGDTLQMIYHLNRKKRFAILYDMSRYKEEIKNTPDCDYYLYDFTTGKKELLVEKQTMSIPFLTVSVDGNRICYFKEGHWFSYDTETKKHYCITKGVGVSFADEDNDRPRIPRTYGSAGWTNDGSIFLFYDKFDLWGYYHKSGKLERLTKGREANLSFRVARFSRNLENKSWLIEHGGIMNLTQGILLEAVTGDHSSSGFFVLTKGQSERPIVLANRRISKIKKALNAPLYAYQEEDIDSPSSIKVISSKEKKEKLLFRSNPQHENYLWGRSELVPYTDSKGQELKGVLLYPAGYDATKSYPMMVWIYEKQNSMLHVYTNPTVYNDEGFNKTLFTTNGYFVFLPDIVYEVGNPGFSAVDCVVAGTKAAIATASINPKRIGLGGHSFGGYETNFIITQTNIFKAALSGSGIADLTSCYLSMGWNYGITDIWRFESEQGRMGKPLFENFEGYSANSPIRHAASVQTPLLSYVGDKDYQVNSFQSMEFFVALRRLKKKHIQLIYPDEEHVIHNKQHQKDLTLRIKEWFDYYLKDVKAAAWMQHDVSPQ